MNRVELSEATKSMNQRLCLLAASVALVLAVSGCATHRVSLPEINEQPRTGLTLNEPVLIAVHDARADKSDSEDVVAALEQGLVRVYGSAIERADFFEAVPDGRVAVRVRIMANGADFGSRTISAVAITNAFTTARAQASPGWQPVVTVAAEQSSVTTVFSADGWWVGTSWLELEIEDKRGNDVEHINLPIVAEEKESNTFGYKSASRASQRAWGKVSQRLFQVLDSLMMTLRDQGA